MSEGKGAIPRWRDDKIFRNAFIAALFCCLFPLSGYSVLDPNTKPPARQETSVVNPDDRGDRSSSPDRLSTWSAIRRKHLYLGTRSIPNFLTGLKRRADMDGNSGDPRIKLFNAAVNR
jgi:hypothetical protein